MIKLSIFFELHSGLAKTIYNLQWLSFNFIQFYLIEIIVIRIYSIPLRRYGMKGFNESPFLFPLLASLDTVQYPKVVVDRRLLTASYSA